MGNTFIKDPDAVLDYKVDWSGWLGSDTISASTWEADDGITIDDTEFSDDETVVVLSGGTAGVQYTITNHITTAAGYEDERSILIIARER